MTSFIWKSRETENRLMIVRAWEWEQDLTATDMCDTWRWWKCSNCIVVMLAQFCKCTKRHWIVHLLGCILWFVNHTSIKLFKKCELIKANKRGQALFDRENNTLNAILIINTILSCFVNVLKSRPMKKLWK